MNEKIRKKSTSLDQHRIMTIATLRPDGWPQATTVGYVNDGLTLYFLCGRDSQKATNLARDDRVSLTIDHDTPQVTEITGLSMAAHTQPVLDREEAKRVLRMLPLKYPEQVNHVIRRSSNTIRQIHSGALVSPSLLAGRVPVSHYSGWHPCLDYQWTWARGGGWWYPRPF